MTLPDLASGEGSEEAAQFLSMILIHDRHSGAVDVLKEDVGARNVYARCADTQNEYKWHLSVMINSSVVIVLYSCDDSA